MDKLERLWIIVMKLLLIISLLGNICYADDGVIHLNQNDKAPYNGYFFTEDKAKDTRIKLLERTTFEGLNESLTKTNTFLQQNTDDKDKQIKILSDRNDQLSTTIQKDQSQSNLEHILWFMGGVLATGLAIKLGHDIYK